VHIPSDFGCKYSVCGVISGGLLRLLLNWDVYAMCICFCVLCICSVYASPAVNTVHIKVCRCNRRCNLYMQTCKGM
jgi:hypothetical protein